MSPVFSIPAFLVLHIANISHETDLQIALLFHVPCLKLQRVHVLLNHVLCYLSGRQKLATVTASQSQAEIERFAYSNSAYSKVRKYGIRRRRFAVERFCVCTGRRQRYACQSMLLITLGVRLVASQSLNIDELTSVACSVSR